MEVDRQQQQQPTSSGTTHQQQPTSSGMMQQQHPKSSGTMQHQQPTSPDMMQQHQQQKQKQFEQQPKSNSGEMSSLGKEHEMLKKTVGRWEVDCTCFGENQKETKHTGYANREMILDGHFLRDQFQMDMECEETGKPFHFQGELLLGFSDGEFFSSWVDNTCNSISFSKGKFLSGSSTDFQLTSQPCKDHKSGKMKKSRTVHSIPSEDRFTFEMYETCCDVDGHGCEKLIMRSTYHRGKKSA